MRDSSRTLGICVVEDERQVECGGWCEPPSDHRKARAIGSHGASPSFCAHIRPCKLVCRRGWLDRDREGCTDSGCHWPAIHCGGSGWNAPTPHSPKRPKRHLTQGWRACTTSSEAKAAECRRKCSFEPKWNTSTPPRYLPPAVWRSCRSDVDDYEWRQFSKDTSKLDQRCLYQWQCVSRWAFRSRRRRRSG